MENPEVADWLRIRDIERVVVNGSELDLPLTDDPRDRAQDEATSSSGSDPRASCRRLIEVERYGAAFKVGNEETRQLVNDQEVIIWGSSSQDRIELIRGSTGSPHTKWVRGNLSDDELTGIDRAYDRGSAPGALWDFGPSSPSFVPPSPFAGAFDRGPFHQRAGGDTLYGMDGDDTLRGRDGDDDLFGGPDEDRIHGGDGTDLADGGAGRDRIHGGDGTDVGKGGAGSDRLYGGQGRDYLAENQGNDTLLGGDGVASLRGGTGDDSLKGGRGYDVLHGGEGDDTLLLDVGGDAAFGDAGDDTFLWNGRHDHRVHGIRGDAGFDVLLVEHALDGWRIVPHEWSGWLLEKPAVDQGMRLREIEQVIVNGSEIDYP